MDHRYFGTRISSSPPPEIGGEIHQLFIQLDEDKSGALQASELVRSLELVVEESVEKERTEPLVAAASAEARKAAEKRQLQALQMAQTAMQMVR